MRPGIPNKARQAREHHRLSQDASRIAQQHRRKRDQLIKALWETDRNNWTYAKLAKAVNCSPELIAKIIKSQ